MLAGRNAGAHLSLQTPALVADVLFAHIQFYRLYRLIVPKPIGESWHALSVWSVLNTKGLMSTRSFTPDQLRGVLRGPGIP